MAKANGGKNGKKDESRPKTRRTMPGKNGGTLTVGGRKGGRPPDEFRAQMRELVSRDETRAYLETCLSGAHGPAIFLKACQYAAERGYGKADQYVEVQHYEPVARFPEPVETVEEWQAKYGQMLHRGEAEA